MSQTTPPIRRPAGRLFRAALVAGTDSLRNLGPVVRHMLVGLLDEPKAVTLLHPQGVDLGSLPVLSVQALAYRFSLPTFPHERGVRALAEGLQESGASVLHALDADALPLARRLAAETRLPYVVGVYALRRDLHLGEDRCRAVLAASQPIRRALLDARAAPPGRLHLFRPGVYAARMATCFTDPQHAVTVVAAGQLHHFWAWSAVLESFAQLRQAGRDCAFFLIGSGRGERPLRRQAEALRLMGDLTFVDRQVPEALTDILRAADIFVAPEPSDRVDMDLLAAMASGTPVLAAEGGAVDFVNPDTALTFPPGQAAELTARISALLDDRAAARSLAENALAYLRENHSPARMVGQLGDLYESVARGSGDSAGGD